MGPLCKYEITPLWSSLWPYMIICDLLYILIKRKKETKATKAISPISFWWGLRNTGGFTLQSSGRPESGTPLYLVKVKCSTAVTRNPNTTTSTKIILTLVYTLSPLSLRAGCDLSAGFVLPSPSPSLLSIQSSVPVQFI